MPTAVGMVAGSRTGPKLTRRMNPNLLRHIITLSGLLLATWLWLWPAT